MQQRTQRTPGALPRREPEERGDAPAPAREAAEALFEVLMAQKKVMQGVAREFGLSLQQLAALRNLVPGDGIPMSVLAEALSCDAANVTGVVDKLEARRLVRRTASRDRRVRLLETTRRGADLREKILARLRDPTPWITALAPEEQTLLRDLLRKGLAAAQPQPDRSR